MKNYYKKQDELRTGEKNKIWNALKDELPSSSFSYITLHWKSFWFGQAAAFLIIFTGMALFYLSGSTSSPPVESNSIQETYTITLQELISAQQFVDEPTSEPAYETLQSELKGLKEIDNIIDELRRDMMTNGTSNAKRRQLKQLYATKLDYAKKLILTSEVNL